MVKLLNTVDDIVQSGTSSDNVMQGFALNESTGDLISTHLYDESGTDMTVYTAHDPRYTSVSIANSAGVDHGHGACLIWESGDDFIVEKVGDTSVGRCSLTVSGATVTPSMSSLSLIPTGADVYSGFITGSTGDDSSLMAFRVGRNGAGTEENVVVYNASDVTDYFDGGSSPTALYTWSFPINADEVGWFQGMTIWKGYIWTLTGNTTLGDPKRLRKHNIDDGTIVTTVNAEDMSGQQIGTKSEPEGLSVIGDQMYYGIMQGQSGANKKYLVNSVLTNGI